jgi:hypothetical protein
MTGVVSDRDKLDETIGPDGMQRNYLVLSEEERSKGFVRPVRVSYRHVGPPGPAHPLRDLTEDERARYAVPGYAKHEQYPEGHALVGRFWTQERLDKAGKGCQSVTTMGRALAETYARQPDFYGGTFCVTCGTHLPVGADGEFVWLDGSRVGT